MENRCTAPKRGHKRDKTMLMCPIHGGRGRERALAAASMPPGMQRPKVELASNGGWREWYLDAGKLHRVGGGPADCEYYADGTLASEDWYSEGKVHRIGAPAGITYYPNGKRMSVTYAFDDKWHRTEGPALITFREDGSVESEEWWIDGERAVRDEPYYRRAKELGHPIDTRNTGALSFVTSMPVNEVDEDVMTIAFRVSPNPID